MMSRAQFSAPLFLILAAGLFLRTIYPAADPPWRSTIGVVWHDEGAWTHNARRIAGPVAGLIAGARLATNYVYVMYDRAAIMEALMAAFIVASWYCSTRAERQPAWGAVAGTCATLGFFTKAAAAFYIGALVMGVV